MISRAVALVVALTVLTPSFAAGQTPVLKVPVGPIVQAANESLHASPLRTATAGATTQAPQAPAGQAQQAAKPQKQWVPRNKVIIVVLIIVSVVMAGLVVGTRPDVSRD